MPAGCDFICENDKCQYYKHGFAMTAPWPLGHIGLVLNQGNVKSNDTFRKELICLKNEGRTYACISLPNLENIEVLGYRIHKWCPKCHCVWQYDVMREGETPLEELLKSSKVVPLTCRKDDERLIDFSEAVEQGIACLNCNEKMNQSRWFSNESEKDKEE